jgi:uncharacterized protein YbbC (DUF1343 family)
LVTNHSAVDHLLRPTVDRLLAAQGEFELTALFAPEHGLNGQAHADEAVKDHRHRSGIPVYILMGDQKRPTAKMLEGLELLVYDVQDIGARSYTYISTLFYVMEAAAEHGIPLLVLDRPNPINGHVVDGLFLESKWRSTVGYVNVPYCHGMTVGELARYFQGEYKIDCELQVVPMRGWQRSMSFADTGIPWVPTSPHIPEPDTPLYYPMTGILGELSLVNIGVGYTLPFKIIGAPWIDGDKLAATLNSQKFPGVLFQPFHFKPFYGKFSGKSCHGVRILVTDSQTYLPVATQYLILGVLKSLYPTKLQEELGRVTHRRQMFAKINGTDRIWELLEGSDTLVWPLRTECQQCKATFEPIRRKYLLPDYS